MKRGNGFDKDPERARLAGKKSVKGKSLKTYLAKVLNETIPEKDLEKFKKKYGISEELTNGEAIIREVVRKAKMTGDVKTLKEILTITGEFEESLGLNIVYLDKQDAEL